MDEEDTNEWEEPIKVNQAYQKNGNNDNTNASAATNATKKKLEERMIIPILPLTIAIHYRNYYISTIIIIKNYYQLGNNY
jgi:hypothetical protein